MRSTPPPPAGLKAFNALVDDAAGLRLRTCLAASGWVSALLAGRPYPDRESLLATAYRFGVVLTDDDLASALAAHPRIGERPAGSQEHAVRSRSEQSGVDGDDADLTERLRAGNLAYESRFDRVFLIRAAGRSGPQILEALTRRLLNDPVTEEQVMRDQLAQIAQLRLAALLDELAAEWTGDAEDARRAPAGAGRQR